MPREIAVSDTPPTNPSYGMWVDTASPAVGPSVTAATDFNACTTTGLYSIAGNATNGIPNGGGNTGAGIGILQVYALDSTHLSQLFFGGPNSSVPEVWTRTCNVTWESWENILGRIPALGNFGFTNPNGIYQISGTSPGGPSVSGSGILTCYGNPLGGIQGNAIQTWTSYVTGEIWQRTNSAGAGFGAWVKLLNPRLCTSSTRPSSPYQGQQIYETDTFRSLTYQTAATGWTPPWNSAWGSMYTARLTTATSAIGTTEIDLWNSGSIIYVANRRIAIIAHYYFTTSVNDIGWWVRYKLDGVWAVPNDSMIRVDSARTSLQHGECVWISTAGAHTTTLSAGTLSGTVTIRGDLLQGYWEIRDVGPAGNPT